VNRIRITFKRKRAHARCIALLPIVLAVAISGCQTATHASRYEQPSPIKARDPGYASEQRYAVTIAHETWMLGDDALDVTLTRPSAEGPFPMVVYMPGLGEPSNGGAAWRQAWAQAGYVVVSTQLPEDSETIWRSAKARNGDFQDLAKEHYSRAALTRRLALLERLLDEVKRRQGGGELRNADASRIALAGFDLGAQTAMAAAGESDGERAPFDLPGSIKCIVAFSPYADFSGPAFDRRFALITVPVMFVTSTEDADPLGVVAAPSLRRAPFENIPPGHKFLLSLGGAPHTLISGRETAAPDNTQARQDSASAQSKDESSQDGSGGRRRGGMRGMQGGRRGGGGNSDAAGSSGSRSVSAASWTAELARAQAITTAFLDAFVKDDPVANEWLARDARRWLADSADLVVK
jgi:dienelactone hydrolase